MNVFNFFKKLWLLWQYRHIDPDVCCCGGNVSEGGYGCPASCRSANEYAISSALNNNNNK